MARLLQQLKTQPGTSKINPIITTEEFQENWKKAREKSAASPHNAHFGHFKVMARDTEVSETMAKLMSIPILTGFSPETYKKMTACLLQKKTGVYRVDKMRTIWLIDAVFSSTCKILARRTYKAAEKTGALAKENFGSRKGLSAIQKAVNTRLSLDIALQKRMATTAVAVDLASCYDQITHPIASLCMQRLGHAETTVTCRFSTVQDLEVNVRTAFGDSTGNNKQELFACQLEKPPQGYYKDQQMVPDSGQ